MMTMICSKNKRVAIAYATLCGEYHKKEHKRNQDAVLVVAKEKYTALCVADGVGSQRFSRYGSRAIVRAVSSVFSDFVNGCVAKKEITATIFKRYKERLKDKYKLAASTTCLFAVITEQYGLFVGQAGDGLCLVCINGVNMYEGVKDEAFLNEVQAVSAARESAAWKTKHYDLSAGDVVEILLTTDGVSGDVIPGKERSCLEYFLREVNLEHLGANARLKRCLKKWGESGSNDDKTVAVYKGVV